MVVQERARADKEIFLNKIYRHFTKTKMLSVEDELETTRILQKRQKEAYRIGRILHW